MTQKLLSKSFCDTPVILKISAALHVIESNYLNINAHGFPLIANGTCQNTNLSDIMDIWCKLNDMAV